MKNAKNTKSVATATAAKTKNTKVANKATGKAKTAKAKAPKVVVTDEVVLDVRNDITEVETPAVVETVTETVAPVKDGFTVCGTCKAELEQTEANFSPMAKGGFRNICKPCQTAASLAWTTKRADYRKDYQRANQLINLGIPAIVPNAKTWQAGDVIMTVEFTRDGVTFPSRPAEEVYTERKQAQADAREARKAEIAAQNDELKQQRADERAAEKAKRDAEKAEAAANRVAEREQAKVARDAERAEQAETARLEREQKAVERAETKRVADAEKAETARLAREAKDGEREAARVQKALDKAEEIRLKDEKRKQAAIDKALAVTV